MADEENKEEQKQEVTESTENAPCSKAGMFVYLIMGAVVFGCAVGGFALAQLIAGPKPDTQSESSKPVVVEIPKGQAPWQYDLNPVVGNLDEPGVTRYLRVATTLIIAPEFDQEEGAKFLAGDEESGKPGAEDLLVDFMSDYIAGLTLERVRGQKNRRRIKKEVTEGFNEVLFPGQKPYVTSVLFKEFAVQ